MTAYELWTCDWHAQVPESGDGFVNEDTARDNGWVRIERDVDVPSALGDGKTWRRHEIGHVCKDCLAEPECHEWIAAEGWKSYYSEDVEVIEAAGRNALTGTGGDQ